MHIDPKNPKWEDRDRFVLSKGHTAPGLYTTLANRGFFPVEDLPTLRHIDSYLQGHPNMHTVPGVDMATGSLGQEISCACGMALGAKWKEEWVPLKKGQANMKRLFEAMVKTGYDGTVSLVDFSNEETTEEKLRNNIEYMHALLNWAKG